jgi:AraC-like DNA-binding protein
MLSGTSTMQGIRFSSQALPHGLDERARFSLWRDLYIANIGSLDIRISEAAPFRADLDMTLYGAVGLASFNGTVQTVKRTPHDLHADSQDAYFLMINDGPDTVGGLHVGREMALAPGAAALMSTQECGSITGGAAPRGGHVWRNLVVPGELMRGALGGVDDLLATSRSGASLAFLRSYLTLLNDTPPSDDPALAAHISTTLMDLLTLVLRGAGDAARQAASRGLRAARIDAVLAGIRDGYTDPGFSVKSLARQLGLSVRYIHDLLQETGTGFAERVLELRLQRSAVLLGDRRSDTLRIADLALAVGFSDVSYFNRCFRRRFGCTPTAMR